METKLIQGQRLPREESVVISKQDMKHIQACLPYGRKKELADFLGISRVSLALMLRPKDVYNRDAKKFKSEYVLPKSIHEKIIKFINQY